MSQNKAETIFSRGIWFKKPHEKAPDFVRGKIDIKVDEIIPFLEKNKNDKGYVNLDLLKSKEKGTLYLVVNTFKKEEPKAEEIKTEDIPF